MKVQRSVVSFAMFAIVGIFAVTLMPTSQQASAVAEHHMHLKAVIPEAHGEPITPAVLKALVKGPYGETDVIGGNGYSGIDNGYSSGNGYGGSVGEGSSGIHTGGG